MDELKFTQVYIRKDTKRELEIMAPYQRIFMADLLDEAIELYKNKHHLWDVVRDFERR